MSRVSEWVLGIVGACVALLGVFILYGGEDQYVGMGGDLSWRVGDIASWWGYGMVVVGLVLLVVAAVVAIRDLRHPEARKPMSEFQALIMHIVVFTIVNAFLWLQDIATGDGLNYAYWVTIPWGVGLIAHIVAYVTGTHGRRALPHH
jgi:2TM domain